MILLFFYFLGVIAAILFGRFYNSYVVYRKLPEYHQMPGNLVLFSWLTLLLICIAFILDLIDAIEFDKFAKLLDKLVNRK